MKNALLLVCLLCTLVLAYAQPPAVGTLQVPVFNAQQETLANASVELLRAKDSSLVKAAITDSLGLVQFDNLPAGRYVCRVSRVNYKVLYTAPMDFTPGENSTQLPAIILQSTTTTLQEVTVSGRKPFIQHLPDKTVVNVDAGISNAGTTVLEVLEKLPGVTIDRDGNISLKGRQGVLILIDGKQTYVGAGDLNTILSSMNSSQVETIELMDNPSARYDAAGNAGVINIKTKKTKQRGFNGSLTASYGQGVHPKNNNSLQLNYRTGAFNFFVNYSMNVNKSFTNLYALRKYYKADDQTIDALLNQQTDIRSNSNNNTLRTGVDYYLNKKTTIGLALNGTKLSRTTGAKGNAVWLQQNGTIDSIVNTESSNKVKWENGGLNLNLRHNFSSRQELTIDIDAANYNNKSYPTFYNNKTGVYVDSLQGFVPSRIEIYSAKADYTERFGNDLTLEAGWKTSHVNTSNRATYFHSSGNGFSEDLGRTNHFLYNETIHALYINGQHQAGKWTLQGGLRFENTSYNANQLGNALRKDSAFTRDYSNLFPSALITFKADTIHQFSITAGRRIDRPFFQKLNPFIFVLNKYTYERGNPYYLPQYTWNFELTHQFKELLTTSLSYAHTTDYFSQIFLTDSNQTLIYTEGNVGSLQNLGLSVSAQTELTPWWSLTADAIANHKRIKGFVYRSYDASISQITFNINNQFHFKKSWAAELSGYYISRAQNDLQEVLEPTGQVAAGVSKQVWKNKGTFKLTVRDIFYTQAMIGNTSFKGADEYFKMTRDSRVATLAFTYRFGKPLKGAARRSNGGAGTEIERVGVN